MPRKRPSKTTTKRRLDAEFAKSIRSLGFCERCGRTDQQLHTHHIVGRANHRLRWEPKNACCLCAACHRHAHNYPLAFADWIRGHRCDDVDYIESVQNEITSYTVNDYLEMLDELKAA